jgi:hypothetical protein
MGAGFIAYPRNEDVDIADQAENGRADGGVFADAIMIEIAGGMESADLPAGQAKRYHRRGPDHLVPSPKDGPVGIPVSARIRAVSAQHPVA